ncbi:hypothetical protein [Streptomyces sp. NPDC057509]|uniref:hypothetical protein n=1 Tax=Streptomyces sp. NPDC057509 TaxID=3346152 RepID=UPI0036816DD6
MFVTRSRYDALHARYVEVVEQRDEARQDAASLLSAANLSAYYIATADAPLRDRLSRALEACTRYRAEAAALRRELAAARAAYDHAVGLDSPALDLGRHWQQRRSDRPVPRAVSES